MIAMLLAALLSPLVSTPAVAQEWTRGEPIAEPADLPALPSGWTTVQGIFLRLHGPEEELPLLLELARHGSERLPALAETLRVPIGTTIHVYVAPSDQEFRALQPGRAPMWADATTWPALGAVFLRTPAARGPTDQPLEVVFDHELVHVLVGRAFAPQTPPTWLQEGIAQLLAGEVGPELGETLARGQVGGLVALTELEHGFPHDPVRARLAYAESADFVAFLQERHGEDALPTLLRASAGGAGLREAVYRATGRLFDDVEAEWQARHEPGTLVRMASLASADWLWSVGAIALVGAGIRRRREFRRRLEEMAEEEALMDQLLGPVAQEPGDGAWTVSPGGAAIPRSATALR